jgi:hypothetical protein
MKKLNIGILKFFIIFISFLFCINRVKTDCSSWCDEQEGNLTFTSCDISNRNEMENCDCL